MEFDLEKHEYIELNKLLKILNLAESGGQANMMITEGEVTLNGTLETRKRKKLFKGDVIVFMGQNVKIV
jgi:ribosome-associated protein